MAIYDNYKVGSDNIGDLLRIRYILVDNIIVEFLMMYMHVGTIRVHHQLLIAEVSLDRFRRARRHSLATAFLSGHQ